MAKCYSSLIYTLSAGGKLNPGNKYTVTEKLNVKEKLEVKQVFSHQRNFDFVTIISTGALYRKSSKELQPMPWRSQSVDCKIPFPPFQIPFPYFYLHDASVSNCITIFISVRESWLLLLLPTSWKSQKQRALNQDVLSWRCHSSLILKDGD